MPDSSPQCIQVGDPVTVVIPAYNLANYLPAAIESVLRQDYAGPISIIVLDDGSTDNTYDVAHAAERQSDSVKVYTQANLGRVGARNRLIDLAKTELIAWIDGDDMAHPAWIREQVTFMADHPDHVAVSGHGYAMTSTGRALGPLMHPLAHDEIEGRHLQGQANAFYQSCVLTRRSTLLRAGGYRQKYPASEDFDLWLRLTEIGKIANVDHVHLLYRVHDRSANWTIQDAQRMQGHQITNEARGRRGLPPLAQPTETIPPPKKDDWNKRVYWINIALRSGNPRSAIELLGPAISRHPRSLLLWIFALSAMLDTLIFGGNNTRHFRPGEAPRFGPLPLFSVYRLGRWVIRLRRRSR